MDFRLTDSKMGVYRGVSSSSCEILSISVGNVFSSFGVSEALCQTEIDHVDVVLLLADTN